MSEPEFNGMQKINNLLKFKKDETNILWFQSGRFLNEHNQSKHDLCLEHDFIKLKHSETS